MPSLASFCLFFQYFVSDISGKSKIGIHQFHRQPAFSFFLAVLCLGHLFELSKISIHPFYRQSTFGEFLIVILFSHISRQSKVSNTNMASLL